jgi:hypothetical protein
VPQAGVAALGGATGTAAASVFGAATKAIVVTASLEAGIAVGSALGALADLFLGGGGKCECK